MTLNFSLVRQGARALARSPRGGLIAGGALAAAAATALWVEHKARKAERDNPPVGRFVEVDGVRLHYIERGEGPPVVLLPGNAVVVQDFEGNGLIDRLSERYRVIAFDRPGYGYSERPRDRRWTATAQAALLRQAFAALGIEQPVVVGHSWGTLVALALGLDHPDDVRGLVLVSGYYYPSMRLDAALVAPAAIPVVGDLLRHTVSPIFARLALRPMVKAMFAPLPVPQVFEQTLPREMLLRPTQLRADAEDGVFMVPAAIELQKRYQELSVPVRLLAGAEDLIVDTQAHTVRLNEDLPRSGLTVVPGAGHMVHYAAPEQVVADVDAVSGPARPASGGNADLMRRAA